MKIYLMKILMASTLFCSSVLCIKKDQTIEKTDIYSHQLQIFQATRMEDNKPTIWDVGDTTITNEDRLDLFQPHITNIGGGYIGVGSTQNFSLAAWARSEWIWLMDFTKIVVRTNRVNIAFLQEADTPEEFRNLWESKSEKEAYAVLDRYYANDPLLIDYKKAWKTSKPFQQKRFQTDDRIFKKRSTTLWLYDESNYEYIKNLARQGRIQALEGDIKGQTTILSIAEQSKKMGIPIRSIYFSNAEEYFVLKDQFRTNWLSIPVDDRSMVLRTISVRKSQFPWAEDSEFSTDRGFHYAVQPAKNFQDWLTKSPDTLKVHEILEKGEIDKKGITVCNGLYSAL